MSGPGNFERQGLALSCVTELFSERSGSSTLTFHVDDSCHPPTALFSPKVSIPIWMPLLRSTLYEQSRSCISEANSHPILTRIKKGRSYDKVQRNKLGSHFGPIQFLFLQAMWNVIFGACCEPCIRRGSSFHACSDGAGTYIYLSIILLTAPNSLLNWTIQWSMDSLLLRIEYLVLCGQFGTKNWEGKITETQLEGTHHSSNSRSLRSAFSSFVWRPSSQPPGSHRQAWQPWRTHSRSSVPQYARWGISQCSPPCCGLCLLGMCLRWG